MIDPGLGNKLKGILIVITGLALATFVGTQIGSSNYKPFILGFLCVVGFVIWFFTGDFFWILTIASSFLGGTFPILGGQFTPFQLLMAMGVVKFLIGDVILRRTAIKAPSRFDLFMIVGFIGVLTIHGIHDRFGMRFLGSTIWGGRHYVNVYVGLAAFIIIQSIRIKPTAWSKLPYFVLGVVSFDLAVAIFTTIFPSSIYRIYMFYSAVSTGALAEAFGIEDVTARIGAFGNFGFTVVLLVLASTSLRTLLHPSMFFRFLALVAGGLAAVYSGFRSAVINSLLGILVAGIRDLKWAVLALLPVLAVALFTLSVINSEYVRLPKQMQRGLTFIPGHWDPEMARDAAASNDFRKQIWTMWARSYFPLHPLLGRGFGFRSEWTKTSTYYGKATDFRQMIEVGNLHNGLLATVDSIGIIGAIFFIIWNFRLLFRALRVSFDENHPAGTALRFLALYLAVSILSYWIGAQDIGTFLPREFALAGVFYLLERTVRPASNGRAHPLSKGAKDVQNLARV